MNATGRKIHHVRLEEDERDRIREILDDSKGSRERRLAGILFLEDRTATTATSARPAFPAFSMSGRRRSRTEAMSASVRPPCS